MISEPEALRARARQYRHFASKYAAETGTGLTDLTAELDRRADRIEAQERRGAGIDDLFGR